MDAQQSGSMTAEWIEGNEGTIESSDPKTANQSGPEKKFTPAFFSKLDQTQRLKMSRDLRLEIPGGTGL